MLNWLFRALYVISSNVIVAKVDYFNKLFDSLINSLIQREDIQEKVKI